MTTLIVGILCILLAHVVWDRVEKRSRAPELDHAAADRALYALAPEFALEMGYVPPPPMTETQRRGLQGAAFAMLGGLEKGQQQIQDPDPKFLMQMHGRGYENEKHRASQQQLAAMLNAAPPNASPAFRALAGLGHIGGVALGGPMGSALGGAALGGLLGRQPKA